MSFSDITSVKQTLKKINTADGNCLAVFDESFMEEHSDFSSFDEFMKASSWAIEEGEFPITLTVGDFNEYVRKNTEFESWEKMLFNAHDRYWNKSEADRRRYPRHQCEHKARVKQGTNQVEGEVKDISKKGLKLQTPIQLKESMIAKVDLQKNQMEIAGVVRWNREEETDYLSGLEITRKE